MANQGLSGVVLIRCPFPFTRSTRSALQSEGYGHPDGHLFCRPWVLAPVEDGHGGARTLRLTRQDQEPIAVRCDGVSPGAATRAEVDDVGLEQRSRRIPLENARSVEHAHRHQSPIEREEMQLSASRIPARLVSAGCGDTPASDARRPETMRRRLPTARFHRMSKRASVRPARSSRSPGRRVAR